MSAAADRSLDPLVARRLLQLSLHIAGRSLVLQSLGFSLLTALGVFNGRAGMAAAVAGLGVCAVAWRFWLVRRWTVIEDDTMQRRALRHLQGNVLLAGLVWATANVGIYPALPPMQAAAYLVLACGAVSAAAFFMSVLRWALPLMLVPQLGPLAVVSLLPGPGHAPLLAFMLAIFVVTLLGGARAYAGMATQAMRDSLGLDQRNEALLRSMEAAQAANLAKSQFLATIGHEIRTPMNGVLGSLCLLGNTPLQEDQRRLLRNAKVSGDNLMAILNDVLDHACIEAGGLKLAPAPMSLHGVAAGAVGLLRANAEAKRLSLVLHVGEGVEDAVRGDAQRLKQVLLNLLGNAIKFTERGAVELRLTRLQGEPGTAAVRFEVLDTGLGLAAAAQERLFQPFQPGDTDRAHRVGGVGLGLFISQRIVEAMGSRIEVISEAGLGSRFGFDLALPLMPATPPAPVAPAASTASTASTPPPLPAAAPSLPAMSAAPLDSTPGPFDEPGLQRLHGRVLLVEDNPVNCVIAVQMLRRFGLQVLEAHDGVEALVRLEHEAFDLVLMDCQMPRLDGYAATRAIRERERSEGRPRLPVLALTADALEEDVLRARDAGMDGHLAKPYTARQLEQLLMGWLSTSSA